MLRHRLQVEELRPQGRPIDCKSILPLEDTTHNREVDLVGQSPLRRLDIFKAGTRESPMRTVRTRWRRRRATGSPLDLTSLALRRQTYRILT
jgi:hypothetical protein